MAPKPVPPVERIRRRITVDPETGCWVWPGATTDNGYGVIQLGRGVGTARTHRVMYSALVRPLSKDETIDHLCANILCCNPEHLEPVTRAENARRQWRDGRATPHLFNASKTHCKYGHPFDAENTHIHATGRRICRACGRARANAYGALQRGRA